MIRNRYFIIFLIYSHYSSLSFSLKSLKEVSITKKLSTAILLFTFYLAHYNRSCHSDIKAFCLL